MTQYGRAVEVRVGLPGVSPRVLSSVQADGSLGLHLAFRAVRTQAGRDDTGDVQVWNPGPATLRELQRDGLLTQVLAGYGDQRATVVYGKLVPGSLRITKDAGTRVASWQVSDGGVDVRAVRVSRAWSASRASEVLDYLRSAADLAGGVIRLGRDVEYVRGYTVSGSVWRELQRIADDTDSRWSVQDNRLTVWPRGEARTVRVLELSPASGLIGSPTPKDRGRVEAVALLAPSLRPGDRYRLRSEAYTGLYVAEDVEHAGDSGFEDRFHTTVVGKPA